MIIWANLRIISKKIIKHPIFENLILVVKKIFIFIIPMLVIKSFNLNINNEELYHN